MWILDLSELENDITDRGDSFLPPNLIPLCGEVSEKFAEGFPWDS
jgi:hypothetical protein